MDLQGVKASSVKFPASFVFILIYDNDFHFIPLSEQSIKKISSYPEDPNLMTDAFLIPILTDQATSGIGGFLAIKKLKIQRNIIKP